MDEAPSRPRRFHEDDGHWKLDVRRAAATVLIVLGGALLLFGGFMLYGREEAFDPDSFADRGVAALQDASVRDEAARRIADQIINRGSADLVAAKPLIEDVVGQALRAGALRSILRAGLVQVNRLVFSSGRESVALDLADAGIVITSALRAIAPSVAKQIPSDVQPKLVQVSDRTWASDLIRLADDVRILGIVLPILSLLCFVGAVAVAVDRRDALAGVGGAVALAAILGLLILTLGRAITVSRVSDEALRPAIGGIWDAFLGTLRTWCLFVGAGGLVLAASALSVLEPGEADEWRARAIRTATMTPRRTAWKVLRAVVLVAVGLVVVLRPSQAVQVLAVAAGGYAIFIGLTELLRFVERPVAARGARRRAAERPAMSRRRAMWALGGGALLLIVAATITITLSSTEDERTDLRRAFAVDACNGYRELCSRPLNQVAFPGTHNSMAAASREGWFRAEHFGGITEQLDDGVRAFLIDTHYGVRDAKGRVRTDLEREGTTRAKIEEVIGPEGLRAAERLAGSRLGSIEGKSSPYLCHVVCELGATPLAEGLDEFKRFLERHPNEVVIIFIEDVVSPAGTAAAFKEAGLLRYAYVHERGEPFPTLAAMIRSGKRMLVMAENNSGDGRYPWYHDGFSLTQETPFQFEGPEAFAAARACEPNRGDPDNPLFQVNHWVEAAAPSPRVHEKINGQAVLGKRLDACKRARGLLPNIVAVNFYDRGDLFDTVRRLNGLPRDAKPKLAGG